MRASVERRKSFAGNLQWMLSRAPSTSCATGYDLCMPMGTEAMAEAAGSMIDNPHDAANLAAYKASAIGKAMIAGAVGGAIPPPTVSPNPNRIEPTSVAHAGPQPVFDVNLKHEIIKVVEGGVTIVTNIKKKLTEEGFDFKDAGVDLNLTVGGRGLVDPKVMFDHTTDIGLENPDRSAGYRGLGGTDALKTLRPTDDPSPWFPPFVILFKFSF
jgi:hypothetical protein